MSWLDGDAVLRRPFYLKTAGPQGREQLHTVALHACEWVHVKMLSVCGWVLGKQKQ